LLLTLIEADVATATQFGVLQPLERKESPFQLSEFVILVTELTRWGRSMLDLFHTLQDLQAWGVSLVAQTGLQFDLRSAQGKLIASLMAALAEFERDLLRERVRSGIAAARKRGVVFGRRPGQRIKADRYAPKVLKLVGEGQSYREISHRLGLSKNTVLDIVKRDRATAT
jgi:DNA invertase Pin-like site-specific DNA recombinase